MQKKECDRQIADVLATTAEKPALNIFERQQIQQLTDDNTKLKLMLTRLNVDYKYHLQTWDSSTLERIAAQNTRTSAQPNKDGSTSPRARSDTILQQRIIELEQIVKSREAEL